jgi:hypothetical protein
MDLKQTVRTRISRDLFRGINYLKKGYQPRTDVVKDEEGDLVAD